MPSDNKQLAPLEALTLQASENNAQMSKYVQQMGQIVLSLDARIRSLETLLQQRVTVSSVQARSVCAAVQDQARTLCDKYSFDYRREGEAFRRAIWRDVKAQFGVSDVHDIPAAYFDLALSFVRQWSSFALVRRLREKRGP